VTGDRCQTFDDAAQGHEQQIHDAANGDTAEIGEVGRVARPSAAAHRIRAQRRRWQDPRRTLSRGDAALHPRPL